MTSGLFIMINDEKSLELCLKYGVYGFYMAPFFENQPAPRNHYGVLADYACCNSKTHIFFFTKREIIYGGIVDSEGENSSFYLNGNTSPIGRKANAPLFWDESHRYEQIEPGVFQMETQRGISKMSQPFILKFKPYSNLSNRKISSDSLYFELGRKHGYPLPSNAIQGLGCCTLTPEETKIALELLEKSEDFFCGDFSEEIEIGSMQIPFTNEFLDSKKYINESHLEFSLLADFDRIKNIVGKQNSYVRGRQVPICPFKPMQFDRADIVLYDLNNPINNGTIPNVIIELKHEKGNYKAYEQVVKYLKWLEQVTSEEDFLKIESIIIAPYFVNRLTYKDLKKRKIDLKYDNQIKLFSLNDNDFYQIKE